MTSLPPPDAHALSTWTTRLGTRAVQRVLDENRQLGIPSALVFRGRLMFEMPDGTLTTDNPFVGDRPGAQLGATASRSASDGFTDIPIDSMGT